MFKGPVWLKAGHDSGESIGKRLYEVGRTQTTQALVDSIKSLGFILSVLGSHWNESHQNDLRQFQQPHTQIILYLTLLMEELHLQLWASNFISGQTFLGPGVSCLTIS